MGVVIIRSLGTTEIRDCHGGGSVGEGEEGAF